MFDTASDRLGRHAPQTVIRLSPQARSTEDPLLPVPPLPHIESMPVGPDDQQVHPPAAQRVLRLDPARRIDDPVEDACDSAGDPARSPKP